MKTKIIIVDDGSPDKCGEIADALAAGNDNIIVIHQQNMGLSGARNTGIDNATGEYIGFVDSDDWIDLDYFEKLYNAATKYNLDIALATNVRISKNKYKKRLNITEEKVYTELQDKIDVCQQWKNECPTNKIYRLTMIKENGITWPEKVYCEDKLFTIKAVYYANGIVTVPNTNYYYYSNPTSTVNLTLRNHHSRYLRNKNKIMG